MSDGHGGDRYFRSDVGSSIAVGCALEAVSRCTAEGFAGSLRADPESALRKVAEEIVCSWREKVLVYDAGHPLTPAERSLLSKTGTTAEDPLRTYGATLLACFMSDECAFCLQIGDGLIAAIGDRDFFPVPDDPECRLNITTSLCQSDPMGSLRFWHATGGIPMAIVLATDGVTGTFESRGSFLRFCRSASCFPLDPENLWPRLMQKAKSRSDASGGDDVSVAAVCRECPELMAMRDSADASYRELDLRTAASAKKRGKLYACGDMMFETCPGGVRLVSCPVKGGEISVPAAIRMENRAFHVVEIGTGSFSKTDAARVSLPYTVRTVRSKAFFKCQRLRCVSFAENPEILPKAFFCCVNLRLRSCGSRAPVRRRIFWSCTAIPGSCALPACGRLLSSAPPRPRSCRDACF